MLTKAEAIRNHRLMWNWIAQTSIQEQRCVSKEEAFTHFGWGMAYCNCWCCEYARMSLMSSCSICPIIWGSRYSEICIGAESEYSFWLRAYKSGIYTTAAKYAYMIAELPERKI